MESFACGFYLGTFWDWISRAGDYSETFFNALRPLLQFISTTLKNCPTGENEDKVTFFGNKTYSKGKQITNIDVSPSWHCKSNRFYPGLNVSSISSEEATRQGKYIFYRTSSSFDDGSYRTIVVVKACDYKNFIMVSVVHLSSIIIYEIYRRTPH